MPSRDAGFAAVTCAALLAYNNLAGLHPWHARWYVPANACATGALLSAATAAGLTPSDIGLTRRPPGRLGWLLPAAVATGWLVIASVPATRPVLNDKRIEGLDGRGVAYQAGVRIPVGTVLWEEVAFRGVLQAAFRRVMSDRAAIAVTGAAFGLWHIRPTVQALRVNGLAPTRRHAIARTAAVVGATAAGGALSSCLRARSGSLAAPVLLHVAINCGGLIAAWCAGRIRNFVPPVNRGGPGFVCVPEVVSAGWRALSPHASPVRYEPQAGLRRIAVRRTTRTMLAYGARALLFGGGGRRGVVSACRPRKG